MRNVLGLADDAMWVALEDRADAVRVAAATETAVAIYFGRELEARAAGRAPNEFYALTLADGSIPVTGCVAAHGAEEARTGSLDGPMTLMTGYRNQDPYVDHAWAIEALGNYVGCDLGSHRYPHGGSPRPR